MEHEYKHKEITEKVIKAFYAVYNALGYGFTVYYAGQVVGEYTDGYVARPAGPPAHL